MTRTTLQFLELLKCGLWGMVPDINLFSGKVDWMGIYDMAERQTVVGVCVDGVLLLPCPSELNAYPFSWLKSKIVHF